MKMNWYKIQVFVERKLEGVIVLLSLPVMLGVLMFEWFTFELIHKIKQKVASLLSEHTIRDNQITTRRISL